MAIQQPISTDYLNSPDHSLSHRVIANDNAAPAEAIVVDSSGNVGIGTTNPTALLHVNQTGTTGNTGYFYRNLAAASTNSPLVFMEQDNAGDDQAVLSLQQYGTGNGLTINQHGNVGENVSVDGALLIRNTLNTGFGLSLYSNMGADSVTPLAKFNADNTAFDQDVLLISNDGTGNGLTITQDGSVGTNPSVNAALLVRNTNNTTFGLSVYSNIDATAVTGLVSFYADNPAFDQDTLIVRQDGTGNTQFLDTNGNAISLNIDSEATSATVLNVTAENTSGNIMNIDSKLVMDYNGNVGIGTTSPTGVLHIKAGTASANTAPLKFTPGVLNTTPVVGCMEFVDDDTDGHLYITLNIGGVVTRKEIAFVA